MYSNISPELTSLKGSNFSKKVLYISVFSYIILNASVKFFIFSFSLSVLSFKYFDNGGITKLIFSDFLTSSQNVSKILQFGFISSKSHSHFSSS